MWFIIGGILSSIAISIYLFLSWNLNYWKKLGVPGPKPQLLFGNLKQSFLQKKHQFDDIHNIYEQYKDSTPFVGIFNTRNPRLIINDPEIVKNVLTKNFKSFEDNEFAQIIDKESDPIFGRNPFLLKGEEWKEKRAEITPAFTSLRMKAMYTNVVDVRKKLNTYISNQLRKNPNEDFNAKELSAKYTIDVVSACIYGIDSKSFTDDKSKIREMGTKLFSQSPRILIYFIVLTLWPSIRKIISLPFVTKDVEVFFTQLLKDATQLRKETNATQLDFLNYLLELQKKKNISHLDMAAHTISFFLDGFETTSSVIAHVLYSLAYNPDVQTKLRNEINEAVNKSGGSLKFEDLNEMEYLDCVFNETLRLYPPGGVLGKVCTIPTELTNYKDKKITIERDTIVLLPIYSIQRDEKYWNKPNEFRPERFEHGGIKTYKEKGVFYPFGDGPRQCLGMRFAHMQSKSAIAEIVLNFQILPHEKNEFPYRFDPQKFIPEAAGGLWVRFKKIEN